MKSLDKFEEEINNCSRCGLCQAVCPIFQLTKNDCTSPKGKFIMLNEMLKNSKKPSKKLKQYILMCLNCSKCLKYCPSKLDILKINSVFFEDFLSFFDKFLIFIGKVLSELNFFITIKKKVDLDKIPKEKILYVKSYNDKAVNTEFKTIEIYEIPFIFNIKFPKLAKAIKNENLSVLAENRDISCIITNNKQLYVKLKKENLSSKIFKSKTEIVYLDDLKEKK